MLCRRASREFGYEPEPESGSLTFASWLWKESFRRNGHTQDASALSQALRETLRRQPIATGDQFERRGKAAADLLKAFETYNPSAIFDPYFADIVLHALRRSARSF
jgi:hypothetical protein